AYLGEQLQARGWQTERLHLSPQALEGVRGRDLLAAVDRAGLIVLSVPLYVDTAPYPVTLAMEAIAAHRRGVSLPYVQRLLAIVQCGFPESIQNETALRIYRRWAGEAGFAWAGGLGLGGGEAVNDMPLQEIGWVGRSIRRALELTADALAEGFPVPEPAVDLMARPLVAPWLYRLFGNRSWVQEARKHGVTDLRQRPYAQP
ncbi:MAG TPA: hypothetical protein VD902_02195, partial [Symbiobacteriaceae bacterium]|nr:hypothetical protein [Symbiobacteriaceae bacterium]